MDVLPTDSIVICNDTSNHAVIYAQSGLTNVLWYNSADIQVGAGDSLSIDVATLGMQDGEDSYYYTGQDVSGCDAGLCCPILVLTEDCAVDSSDYLDLCIIDPCHLISADIYLGDTITSDNSVLANGNATGDVDEGVTIFSSIDIVQGGVFRLPVTMYNVTGDTSYLHVWVDWNGDGDFIDASEVITTNTYPPNSMYTGSYQDLIQFNVPAPLSTNQIGFRFRFSTDDSIDATDSCGTGTCAIDGEVEDYIILVNCKDNICLPITTTLSRGSQE